MRRRTATISGLVALSVVAAACGNDSGIRVQSATPIQVEVTEPAPSTAPPTTSTTTPESTPSTAPSTAPAEPVPTTNIDVLQPDIVEPVLAVRIPFEDVVDADDNKTPRDQDEFVAVAFTDIERWWSEVYSDIYGDAFDPLAGGIYAGYPERRTPIPGCGEPETSYEDLQLYVAFYCDIGDFMAYDDGDDPDLSLLTPLAESFGAAVMGVVLAHEYGHAIQARIGALDRPLATIVTEQQADCFAGAWTGQAYRGESPLLRLGDADVRAGLLAMLEVRDPVGTDQFTPGGHGSAFDRVGAFQVGFLDGPSRCAELLDDPLDLMPNSFRTGADAFFEGNAPYECDELDPAVVGQDYIDACVDAPDFLARDINHFWQTATDGAFVPFTIERTDDLATLDCSDGYSLTPQAVLCPADRKLVYDEPAVRDLYDEFGDFTLGYIFGIAGAEFAQIDLGSTLTGEPRALLDDCFTGAWVRDITPDAQGRTPRDRDEDGDGFNDAISSSPGDLDEAIRMEILLGDLGANLNVVGTAFEKIDAFRTGVLNGLSACEAG